VFAQKRLLAIHDISCFGRCSLTVALPIISAAGIETSVIPTAVLSTHTGGFTGFTFRDLTDDILPIVEHWKREGIRFDAVYTGYLGSVEQVGIILRLLEEVRTSETLVVVDPVMADGGKLYSLFPQEFPSEMRKLCAVADVIVPNLSEASLLTGLPYYPNLMTLDEVRGMLSALAAIGPKQVVLTGVRDREGVIGAACIDASDRQLHILSQHEIGVMLHGTGDVFSSVLAAALVKGRALPAACRAAVEFTVACIERTVEAHIDHRFGVNFEEGLPSLLSLIESAPAE